MLKGRQLSAEGADINERSEPMSTAELFTIIIGGGTVAALISGIVQVILWKLNRKAKKQDEESDGTTHIKNALCVILYDRIKYLGRHHIGMGFITVEDLEDLTKMYTSYKTDLDGNGFLDNLMSQVKSLPLHK
jgi:hypothetical protein